MPDYLPVNDAEFRGWLQNFLTVLNSNLPALGLVAADVTPLTTSQNDFNTALTDQVAKEATFRAAVQVKSVRRTTAVNLLRPLVRRITNHPGMTDGLRANLGLTVPTRTRTRRGVGPEVPGLVLDLEPGRVIVHFGTTPGNEQTNGKPAWAIGCNIYRKKQDETDYTLIAFDTASPYADVITGPAINVSYQVAYRGVRENDLGGRSPEQIVAVGS